MSSLNLTRLIITFAALAIGAFAIHGQTGASLKPSDLNNMVAFYEWALEAKFKPDQRQQLQAALEDELNQSPTKARSNLDIVLKYWFQVKQGGEEMRRKARAEFVPGYLTELRKRANPKHVFLLEIYKAEHGGRETFTDLDAARGNVIVKSDLHAASGDGAVESLRGRWERSTGSGSIGDGTGKTKYGHGKTFSFQFGPDGAITYRVAEKTLSIMGCKIETAAESTGSFRASDGVISMELGTGTEVGTDSCAKAGNYKKALPASNISVKYKVKQLDDITRPDKPIVLCFDNGNGEVCFERVVR